MLLMKKTGDHLGPCSPQDVALQIVASGLRLGSCAVAEGKHISAGIRLIDFKKVINSFYRPPRILNYSILSKGRQHDVKNPIQSALGAQVALHIFF
jgi:hypothetical protein